MFLVPSSKEPHAMYLVGIIDSTIYSCALHYSSESEQSKQRWNCCNIV